MTDRNATVTTDHARQPTLTTDSDKSDGEIGSGKQAKLPDWAQKDKTQRTFKSVKSGLQWPVLP
jgi:hypothetical protein